MLTAIVHACTVVIVHARTVAIVHACTIDIVHISCSVGPIVLAVEAGTSVGRSPQEKQKDLGGRKPPDAST